MIIFSGMRKDPYPWNPISDRRSRRMVVPAFYPQHPNLCRSTESPRKSPYSGVCDHRVDIDTSIPTSLNSRNHRLIANRICSVSAETAASGIVRVATTGETVLSPCLVIENFALVIQCVAAGLPNVIGLIACLLSEKADTKIVQQVTNGDQ